MEINQWTKSSKSNGSGGNNCVEVLADPVAVLVRNSKTLNAGTLKFTPEEWTAFIGGVKAGEFDL